MIIIKKKKKKSRSQRAKSSPLLRSRRAEGLALAAVWGCMSGQVKVLLGDEVGTETRSLHLDACVGEWSVPASSPSAAAFPAPTAVVRCSGESDVCAQRSQTTTVKTPEWGRSALPVQATKITPSY